MRASAFVLLSIALVSPPAAAQTLVAAPKYDAAPWWMDQPIIASVGFVEAEEPANRASLSARFNAVAKTSAEASQAAAAKVKPLGDTLGRIGPERVRVQITVGTQPLYQQYRDREGNRVENERADRVEQYEANATVDVEVRDMGVLQQVVAAIVGAAPTSTADIRYRLEPSNEAKTEMARKAVADAAARARLSVEATGARLGPVKLIDPTGRACQTDVLVAGAPRSFGAGVPAYMVTGGAMQNGGAVPMAALQQVEILKRSGGEAYGADAVAGVVNFAPRPANNLSADIPVQPPFQKWQAQACVVYALAG